MKKPDDYLGFIKDVSKSVYYHKIESFVDKLISGEDLKLDDLNYPKEDKVVCDAIVLRLNFLKHCYIRAQQAGNGDMAVHIFSRMCMLVPGFMIAE